MAVTTGPAQARAIAVFNPTAPEPGFLQPLLVGSGGDNRSYVQIFSSPDRITAFMEVAWPGRDFVGLAQEPVLDVGGQTLWGFAFPDEQPIVSLWSDFRTMMRKRIDDPKLADRPLLQFDIVDTLDLDEAKQDVFTRAYRSYTAMGRDTANRWRDRAILEPALARMLPSLKIPPHRTTAGEFSHDMRLASLPRLRARTDGDEVIVYVEGAGGSDQQRGFQGAYEMLVEQFPGIFPGGAKVMAMPPPRRSGPLPGKLTNIVVVLAGRIRRGDLLREKWTSLAIEVVDESHFHPELRSRQPPALTIILGAQADWPLMAEVGMRMDDRPAIVVSLSTSAVPLMRDLKFQSQTALPTITFFAPYATSSPKGRDPVAPIRPILDVLQREMAEVSEFDLRRVLPTQHNIFIREPISVDQTPVEISCRLAARALKAGAIFEGPGRLYSQGPVSFSEYREWAMLLGRVFPIAVEYPDHIDAQSAALLLFVEGVAHYNPREQRELQRSGIRRLFEMRGWAIGAEHGLSFELEDGQRRFSVVIVDHLREIPPEDPGAQAPGLTRAPLLVIHTQARREQLLIGNRGQFFHASVEDIGSMEPGTLWVWAILRRQLFDGRTKASQAALRLSAALIVEAIRQQRVQPSISKINWAQVHELLAGPDCERFIRFVEPKIRRDLATFEVRASEAAPADNRKLFIELYIEPEGPVVQGVDFTEPRGN